MAWGQNLPLPSNEFQLMVEGAVVVARLESYDVLGSEMPELRCKWENCENPVASHKGIGGFCARLQDNGKTHRQMHIEKVRETNPEFLKHSSATVRKISAGVKRQKHERKPAVKHGVLQYVEERHAERQRREAEARLARDLNAATNGQGEEEEISHELAVIEESKREMVIHPDHYGGDEIYEVIKVLEAWWPEGVPFNLGNAVKYIARAGKKDPEKYAEDLRKALFYLMREISLAEGVVFHATQTERAEANDPV